MPALWQSSQRPMYVRTVWVDGFRHAILTHDDPHYQKLSKKRRPNSSATCTSNLTNTARSSRHKSADCRKFNFVVRNTVDREEVQVEKLDLTEVDKESEDDLMIKASQQPLYELENGAAKFNLNMKGIKTNRTARQEVKENTELSDRVLQWLDLAGKVDLLAPQNGERMSQPRHSWPEIQQKNQLTKSKTTVDFRAREIAKIASPKPGDSAKAPYSGIDRPVYYEPTSANTIESYARQSRTKSSSRQEPLPKTRDNTNKTKHKDLPVHMTRQKVAAERQAVEKQYADLVNKRLIPDLKATKRQVHIFMPEMIKKGTSETTSRTESLLSQFSQLTHKSK